MKLAAIFRRAIISSLVISPQIGSYAFSTTCTEKQAPEIATSSKKKQVSTTTEEKKNNPINVFGIDHVVLQVDDLEGMATWYQTVLGCKVAKCQEKFKMIHLDAGSALIDLVDKTGPLGNHQTGSSKDSVQTMDHLCLALTDFDEPAIREHLASHGVNITTEIGVRYGKGGYGESLYFQDPEGTRIEIKKSRLLN